MSCWDRCDSKASRQPWGTQTAYKRTCYLGCNTEKYIEEPVSKAYDEASDAVEEIYDDAADYVTNTDLSEADGQPDGLLYDVLDTLEEVPIAGQWTAGAAITDATWADEVDQLEDELEEAEDEYDAAKEEYEDAVEKNEEFAKGGSSTLAEQCALMSLFDYLSSAAGHDPTGVHNPNIVMVKDNVPDAGTDMMMHKLITNPKFNGFYSLTPAKLSALTPKVKLYFLFEKIRDRDGNVWDLIEDFEPGGSVEVLIPFMTNIADDMKGDSPGPWPLAQEGGGQPAAPFDYGAALHSSEQRGWGAGLESFEWDMFGKTTFTADKDIKAKAKFYFASFDEFLRMRRLPFDQHYTQLEETEWTKGGPFMYEATTTEYEVDIPDVSFKYSDLASYDGSFLENLGYTLKADVGWEWSLELNNHLKINHGFTDGELEAVENSSHTLLLRKTTHKLDIREDGSVTLECEYIANSAGLLGHDKLSNILLSEQMIDLNADNDKMRAAIGKCPAGDARSNAYSDLHKAYKALKESMVEAQLLRIVSLLNGETYLPEAAAEGDVINIETETGTGAEDPETGESVGGMTYTTNLRQNHTGVNRSRDASHRKTMNPYSSDVKIHSIGLPIEAWIEISQAGAPDRDFSKITKILEKYADDLSETNPVTGETEADLRAAAQEAWESSSAKSAADAAAAAMEGARGTGSESGFGGDMDAVIRAGMGLPEDPEQYVADKEEEFIQAYMEEQGLKNQQDQTDDFQQQVSAAQETGEYVDPVIARQNAAEAGDVDPERPTANAALGQDIGAALGDAEITWAFPPATPIANYGKFAAIGLFGDEGTWGGADGANGQHMKKETDRYEENAETYREAAKDLKYKRIYYCYFKDLMDAIFYLMKSNAIALGWNEDGVANDYYLKKIDKFRLVLGNIEIAYDDTFFEKVFEGDDALDKYMIKNIGNVPISVALLRKFLINKIVRPKSSVYNFLDFTKDVIQELIVGTINDSKCWGKTIYQSPTHAAASNQGNDAGQKPQYLSIHNTIVSAGTVGGVEVFDNIRYGGRQSVTVPWTELEDSNLLIDLGSTSLSPPMLKQSTPRDPIPASDMYDYAIFYVPQIKKGRTGNFEEDTENGIQHYFIGSRTGIVKSIKFNKSDSKGLREARIEASGDSSESLHQLLDRYDATIELYGNAKIIPGSMLYIDPKGFSLIMGDPWDGPEAGSDYYKVGTSEEKAMDIGSPSPSWILGIGGYYLVTQIASKIGAGEFSTTIKAMWTDGGEMFVPPEAEDRDEGDALGGCADMAGETQTLLTVTDDGTKAEMVGGVGAYAVQQSGIEGSALANAMAARNYSRQQEGVAADADEAARKKEAEETWTFAGLGETIDEIMK